MALTPEQKQAMIQEMEQAGYDWKSQVNNSNGIPQIEEVMHPNISTMERATVKNLANSPEATIAYLKQEHPDMEFKLDNDQEVIAKAPGETSWKKLDPQSSWAQKIANPLETAKELGRDILDVGTDVVSGLGTGAATAAGGLLGLVTPVPGAALAGAAATGGTTSAAAEALRQYLGKQAGIPQEVNPEDVAFAGAAGAVSPLLFGTGKVGLEATKQAAQRGLLGRAVAPVGELMTGISSKTLSNLPGHLPWLKRIERAGDLTSSMDRMARDVKSKINGALSKEADFIMSQLENAGEKVDISGFRKFYEAEKAKLENIIKEHPAPELRDRLNEIKVSFERILKDSGKPGVPAKPPGVILDKFGKPIIAATEAIPAQAPQYLPDMVNPKTAWELQKMVSELGEYAKAPKGLLSSTEKKSFAQKDIKRISDEGYHLINSEFERVTNNPRLKDKYAAIKNLQRNISPIFKDSESIYRNLTNLGKKQKYSMFQNISKADEELGTDIGHMAGLLDSFHNFSQEFIPPEAGLPAALKEIAKKRAGTALLGSVAGYQVGGVPGAILGGAGGGLLSSPANVRRLIAGSEWMRAKPKAIAKATKGYIAPEQLMGKYITSPVTGNLGPAAMGWMGLDEGNK